MAQSWYVIRDGREMGPYSGQQLKEMAAKGKLISDDLVRREDMKAASKASSIKGLFATVGATPPKSSPFSPETSPPASKTGHSKKTLIIASVVGGACLFLCCGGFGVIAIIGHKMTEQLNKELDEADAFWQSGKKDEAIAVYREKRQSAFLDSNNKRSPVVYGRLIDYEYEKGNADAGKSLIDEADKKGITPTLSHTDAKAALAALQAEKARIEAEKAEQKRLAETEKAEQKRLAEAKRKEEERKAKLTPLDKLKEAPLSELVHAALLYNDFNGNEVAAVEKYKGKTIMVVGQVESVEKGGAFSSDKIILARSRGGLPAVYCAVSGGNADELAKLQPGDLVRVQGRCDGKTFLGTVEMSGCIFVKVATD